MDAKIFLAVLFCALPMSAVHGTQANRHFGGGHRFGNHFGGGFSAVWSGNSNPSGNPAGDGINGVWSGNSNPGGAGGGANAGGGISSGNTGGASSSDSSRYCHWYANTAINQAHAVRAAASCSGLVSGAPSRWALSYTDHYDRCLSLFGSGQNASEHRTRAAQLDQCVNR